MKKQIWIKVEGHEAKYLETVRNQEAAELRVSAYERADRH